MSRTPLFVLVFAMSVAGALPALAYDGDDDMREGEPQTICGLADAGRDTLPLRACAGTDCAVTGELAPDQLVLPIAEPGPDAWQEVARLDEFTFWANLSDPETITGFVEADFLCKAPYPSAPD